MTAQTPSLRRKLLLNLLLPVIALAIVLGAGGVWLIRGSIEAASDRLLDGSVLAIAERVVFENNDVTVDLPPVALGMLESQAHDSIYYAIIYDDALVTGYKDLPRADIAAMEVGETKHWDADYRGGRVRLGAQLRRLYDAPHPVLVEVAETIKARRQMEERMYGGLAALEGGLILVVGMLAWRAVGRGLRPLADLSHEIDNRAVRGAINLTPLNLAGVPREALAPAAALNALLQRLDQSIAAMRHFTADASHQMRTPLAILRTHVDLIRRDGKGDKAANLHALDAGVTRLERLLKQMLSLAHADESQSRSELADRADVREVAANVAAALAPRAIAARIELQFEAPEEQILVVGSPILVEEIITNLVDNAIRYNRSGGHVTLRVIGSPDCAVLEVEDDGPGIPCEERTRVFDRFYRLARRENPEGSGLGLAIVRAVADRLGAVIELAEGCGSAGLLARVRFRLIDPH